MINVTNKKENFKLDPITSLEIVKKVLWVLVIVFTIIYGVMGLSLGIKFILNALMAVIFAREAEMLFLTHHKKMNRINAKEYIEESKPEVAGLLLALFIPVSAPLYVTIIGVCFGVFVVRMAFGGFKNNIFNTAVASLVFIVVSWTTLLSSTGANSLVDYLLSLIMNVNYSSINHLLFNGLDFTTLMANGYHYISLIASLLIVACFVYMWAQKVIKPLNTIIALALFYIVFLILGFGDFGLMFITSPAVLLVTIFCLNDPVTTPNSRVGFCVAVAILVISTILMLVIKHQVYSLFFAVLIMNMFVPLIDARMNKPSYLLMALLIIIGGVFATNEIKDSFPIEKTTTDTNGSATSQQEGDSNSSATGESEETDTNGSATSQENQSEDKKETEEQKQQENKKDESETKTDADASATKEGN